MRACVLCCDRTIVHKLHVTLGFEALSRQFLILFKIENTYTLAKHACYYPVLQTIGSCAFFQYVP